MLQPLVDNQGCKSCYEKPLKNTKLLLKLILSLLKLNKPLRRKTIWPKKAYDIKLADYKEKKRLYDEAQAAYLIDNELYKKKKRNTMMLKMPSIRWLKSVVETLRSTNKI